MVAKADPVEGPSRPPPTAVPIFGNTKRKTKQSRNGCTSVRVANSVKFFCRTTRSRSMSARRATRLAVNVDRVGRVAVWPCSALSGVVVRTSRGVLTGSQDR
jgi:hypothetical protein